MVMGQLRQKWMRDCLESLNEMRSVNVKVMMWLVIALVVVVVLAVLVVPSLAIQDKVSVAVLATVMLVRNDVLYSEVATVSVVDLLRHLGRYEHTCMRHLVGTFL